MRLLIGALSARVQAFLAFWFAIVGVTCDAAPHPSTRPTSRTNTHKDRDCKPEGRFRFICNVNNPEDLEPLGDSGWVIASNMGTPAWERGGIYAVSAKSHAVVALVPDFASIADAGDAACPKPDPILMASHGISVVPDGKDRFDLYTVNHGGRQSIEIFTVDTSGVVPKLWWRGCALLPGNAMANGVAALPGRGFAATVFATSDAVSRQAASEGKPSGFVLEWMPGVGWTQVPGSELSGDNGIVASRDGKTLFINAYTDLSLYSLSRGKVPYERRRVQLNFLADNVKFAPSGALLVTGHPATRFSTITKDCNGSAVVVCGVPTAVARVEPATLKSQLVLIEQNTSHFGGGTTAIVVGDDLWLGAFRAQRIGRIALRDLAVQP